MQNFAAIRHVVKKLLAVVTLNGMDLTQINVLTCLLIALKLWLRKQGEAEKRQREEMEGRGVIKLVGNCVIRLGGGNRRP